MSVIVTIVIIIAVLLLLWYVGGPKGKTTVTANCNGVEFDPTYHVCVNKKIYDSTARCQSPTGGEDGSGFCLDGWHCDDSNKCQPLKPVGARFRY